MSSIQNGLVASKLPGTSVYNWKTDALMKSHEMYEIQQSKLINGTSIEGRQFLEDAMVGRRKIAETATFGSVSVAEGPLTTPRHIIDDKIDAIQPTYATYKAKPTIYTTRYAEQDAVKMIEGKAYLGKQMVDVINQYWKNKITELGDIILSSLSQIPTINHSVKTAPLSSKVFYDLKAKSKTMQDFSNMSVYMNTKTYSSLMTLQDTTGKNDRKFLLENTGLMTMTDSGMNYTSEIRMQAQKTWMGHMPIYYMDKLADGVIAFIKNKSLYFNMVRDPGYIRWNYQPGDNKSYGAQHLHTRIHMLLHPKDFSFSGIYAPTKTATTRTDLEYLAPNGLLEDEWEKNKFELVVDPKDSPVNFLNVKITA